ncbi:hypothetical protein [Aquimarina algiphila]|nr:hypothetical protein [Aquimarina algiphila]
MTRQQKINKVEELEFWLSANPNHTDYHVVLKDKLKLDNELAKEVIAHE